MLEFTHFLTAQTHLTPMKKGKARFHKWNGRFFLCEKNSERCGSRYRSAKFEELRAFQFAPHRLQQMSAKDFFPGFEKRASTLPGNFPGCPFARKAIVLSFMPWPSPFALLAHPAFYRKTEREDHVSFQAVEDGRVARGDSDLRSGSESHTARS